jgi:hypothetical protein
MDILLWVILRRHQDSQHVSKHPPTNEFLDGNAVFSGENPKSSQINSSSLFHCDSYTKIHRIIGSPTQEVKFWDAVPMERFEAVWKLVRQTVCSVVQQI